MIYCVIPARLESTRLPGKLLLNRTGKPLLQHTWEAARSASSIDQVIIATDSQEIANTATSFGATVVMTGQHSCGTDRVAEVAKNFHPDDIIVNLQGDEPEIKADDINLLIDILSGADIATLAAPITEIVAADHSNVKCVCGHNGVALYFSRLPVPNRGPWLLHVGIYAFRRDTLLELHMLPATVLEHSEQLEQLRALENGYTIKVGLIETVAIGIDTPDDYGRFVRRYLSHG